MSVIGGETKLSKKAGITLLLIAMAGGASIWFLPGLPLVFKILGLLAAIIVALGVFAWVFLAEE